MYSDNHGYIVDAAYTVFMQLLAICREGNDIWFCSSHVGHHIGMNMGWKHYSGIMILNLYAHAGQCVFHGSSITHIVEN